jgi:hypothetical protein
MAHTRWNTLTTEERQTVAQERAEWERSMSEVPRLAEEIRQRARKNLDGRKTGH